MSFTPRMKIEVYDSPHHFEPLLPQTKLEALTEKTRAVFEKAHALKGALCPPAREALRELVREMNSYHSNRIEGQSTHPQNVSKALKKDFSANPEIAQRQRIALAHIEAERELEADDDLTEARILGSEFLLRAHASLYGRLSIEDRTTPEGRIVEPGRIRAEEVSVGRHHAPAFSALPKFLSRMDQVYGRLQGVDALLYTIAAAHHRIAWTHAFVDGNGRAARLQTHTALSRLSGGLWSVNRGLARDRDAYYAMLSNADMPRQGDLDGRGNLSERMLWEWCNYFIDLCNDQVSFMTKMFDVPGLRDRVKGLVLVRSQSSDYRNYRSEAVLPLLHVLLAGSVSRGDFSQMTGMGERGARNIISQLLKDGLLVSDSHRAELRIGFPLDALNILFPNLYPEAAAANLE